MPVLASIVADLGPILRNAPTGLPLSFMAVVYYHRRLVRRSGFPKADDMLHFHDLEGFG